jgi:hypothetical protein
MSDIRPAPERQMTESADRQTTPSENAGSANRVLSSLVLLPDPACRFSTVEALIVLGCCAGCLWLAVETHRLVNSRPWDAKQGFVPTDSGGREVMLPRDYLFNFLLGLGPACPLILLNQYVLRRRRSWPKAIEWLWLWVSVMALNLLSEALPYSYRDAFWDNVPMPVRLFLLFLFVSGGCYIPLVWLAALLWQRPRWPPQATWTEWLAIVSVPLLYMVGCAWANGIPPL